VLGLGAGAVVVDCVAGVPEDGEAEEVGADLLGVDVSGVPVLVTVPCGSAPPEHAVTVTSTPPRTPTSQPRALMTERESSTVDSGGLERHARGDHNAG
jgi:hypothetical protein